VEKTSDQAGVSVRKQTWVVSLGLLLPACGGGGASTPTPVASPSPSPAAACSQTILFQGNGVVAAGGAAGQEFTVPSSADTRLDVAADWSSSSSLIGVYVVSGACSLDAFNARTCTFLLRSEPTSVKPRVLSAPNVAPGAYTLVVADFTTFDESLAVQVVLSNASCAAVATAPPAAGTSSRPELGRLLR
jgi:hypothetical protein